MKRYCDKFIREDLKKKMVFIGGPRQVGKTTLSKQLLTEDHINGEYFNWDVDEDRKALLKKQWKEDSAVIIFDELHKYIRWKRWIKGVWDSRPNNQTYLVTGSARLDVYKKGGDSLMGRYHYWRMHPLTLDELPPGISKEEGYKRLLAFGGFPEPFLKMDEREARRWRRERFDRIIGEDVRDLEHIRNIQLLHFFVEALRNRVGGLVTLSNLAADLEISPKTAKTWLGLSEKMYMCFAIYPFIKNVPRSIIKPPKVFFFDNGDVEGDDGAKLENLVATHLLKRLHFYEDYHGYTCKLHYIRDKDGREVDFVVIINGQITDLIEVKWKDANISVGLSYYKKLLKPERAVQIVGNLDRTFDHDGIRVTTPIEFFQNPPWDEVLT
jgi:predicted AAA+ superfamily ATPase